MLRETLITVKEASALLHISVQGVHAAMRRGSLQGEKKGRDWLFSSREVEDYRKNRKVGRPRNGLGEQVL